MLISAPFLTRTFVRVPLLLFLGLLGVSLVRGQTADEVITNYIKARGGLTKIKAVQSERVTGSITLGPGVEGSLIYERKRTLKMRMEIILGGQSFLRIYDGKGTGWTYNPFAPNASVQPMAEDELRSIVEEADFEGPFVDYKSKGNQIEFMGKEQVEGKPAYKLKLTNKSKESSYFLFDASTGLIMKWQGTRKLSDKDLLWETNFRDFREVEGLKYPFLVESGPAGTDQFQKIVADKIEVNISIDDARFGKPNIPTPPPVTVDPSDNSKPN